ncbi:CBS domain-containing protein [Wenzhouxiangella sp. XN79A]|uniref:CBS domain-containing protein n=1 Tax=Wenzhouxiangella sp. XN79A TaxID=2724193 RepID=UPI00144A8995|nr:CBS domain-containing protein [Wenzhouxiangella sp. XN79A]NKI35634.1 CBS domain-containing protein [Wenzhouxiangella sp. XN79A]
MNDEVRHAAESMARQRVYRLLVLDDRDNKKRVGVVSLGDLLREGREDLATHTARHIAEAA